MQAKRRLKLPIRSFQNLGLAVLVASASVYLWPPERHNNPYLEPIAFFERLGYDFLFAIRGPKLNRVDPRIEIVGFDFPSERDLGVRWPPPRRFHAQVIRSLAEDGAKLIVYDVLFSGGTNPEDDKALDQALKDTKIVVLPSRIDRDYGEMRKSLEEPYYDDALGIDFLDSARVGFAEVPTDRDGVVRRLAPTQSFQDRWLPSLAAAALQAMHNAPEESINVEKDTITIAGVAVPRNGPTVSDLLDKKPIPSAYMDFPAGFTSFDMDVSFAEVAQKRFNPGRFKGKIVFVGLFGTQLTRENFDQYATAYTNLTPEQFGSIAYKNIPGVVVQAQSLNAMLTDGYVSHLPDWAVWTIVFGLTLAGAWAVRTYFNFRGPMVLLLCVLGYIAYAIMAFHAFKIHVPWIVPSFLMLSSVSLLAYLERGALRRKWSGYVSPAVLEQILRSEDEGVAVRTVATVIFGDLRGFTAFTNKHSPETVISLLNQHFERQTQVIYEQHGTVDKFMGDGIMVLFGVPVPRDDSAVCAVRAAWQMCEISKRPLHLDGQEYVLECGFGVTTGPMVAGHVGSRSRHDYTVIGDIVNLSARLQGVTGEPDVVIDAATYALVRPHVEVQSLGEVRVKGIPDPVPCYKVTAWHEHSEGQQVHASESPRRLKKPLARSAKM